MISSSRARTSSFSLVIPLEPPMKTFVIASLASESPLEHRFPQPFPARVSPSPHYSLSHRSGTNRQITALVVPLKSLDWRKRLQEANVSVHYSRRYFSAVESSWSSQPRRGR